MSVARYRRRRYSRVGGAAAVDPYELFMDALCNALGTIMFVMLCIAIFSRVPDGDEQVDPVEAEKELKALEASDAVLQAELTTLLATLASLPPAGDPEIARRWKEVLSQFDATHAKKIAEVDLRKEAQRQFQASGAQLKELLERKRDMDDRLARLEKVRKELNTTVQFVRTSRFRADARKAVLLLCSGGRVSVATVAPGTVAIAEPQGEGNPVMDAAGARLLVHQLFSGKAPGDWRAEVAIWPSGFAAYKLLERAMIDQGYAINPLVVPPGESIRSGLVGGVQ